MNSVFKLKFKTDNAAFDEPATEIARILEHTAQRIKEGELPPFSVRDINGNTVGRVLMVPEYRGG